METVSTSVWSKKYSNILDQPPPQTKNDEIGQICRILKYVQWQMYFFLFLFFTIYVHGNTQNKIVVMIKPEIKNITLKESKGLKNKNSRLNKQQNGAKYLYKGVSS